MQWLFAITLFVSAALLFVVQPMFAKMVLPLLGGSPAVWNTCMVFYQAALLAGYVYAHLSVRWLGVRRQAAVHLGILCLPWLVLPIGVAAGWTPPTEANPILWLLLLLSISVGLPFLVVSASAPMLQAWFAGTGARGAEDPYFLYAASNLGSMLALLGYPVVVEPLLSLTRQSVVWAAGYGVLVALVAACAAALWLRPGRVAEEAVTPLGDLEPGRRSEPAVRSRRKAAGAGSARVATAPELPWPLRIRWLLLAAVPSSLLLGVTAHISTDIAAVPLLWVVPLALYLLTFVLVFARRKLLAHAWMVRLQVFLILPLAVLFFHGLMEVMPWLWLLLHLATFFVTAMVCHGALAETRPDTRHLTEFYLWISVGGVLGGMFNALVAPVLFSSIIEYPLMIAAACLLRPAVGSATEEPGLDWADLAFPAAVLAAFGGVLFGLELANYYISPGFTACMLSAAGLVVFFFRKRPIRLALGVGAILAVGALDFGDTVYAIHADRDFFGVIRVTYSPYPPTYILMHGSTKHGMQWVDGEDRDRPLSYYTRSGPLGDIFEAMSARGGFRDVGVTGLGVGAVAGYGEPGWRMTYYEIDPAVVRIARDPRYFHFLADCRSTLRVVLGDARRSLQQAAGARHQLLVLDAFTSDAIPIHLITREAVELYLDRLAPDGVIAFHISNRYLDLKPVLGNIAAELGLECRGRDDEASEQEQQKEGKDASSWVVMARREQDLGKLASNPDWKPVPADAGAPSWTDDFSNIVSVLKWKGESVAK